LGGEFSVKFYTAAWCELNFEFMFRRKAPLAELVARRVMRDDAGWLGLPISSNDESNRAALRSYGWE